MKSKLFRFLILILLLVSFSMAPEQVLAKAYTYTYHEEGSDTLIAWNPCFGLFKGTLTYDKKTHITENKNSYHEIILMKGTAFVESLEPGPPFPPFTGRFSEKIVRHTAKLNDFKIQIITQMGDGLEFHITYKVSYDDGVPTTDIFNYACGN